MSSKEQAPQRSRASAPPKSVKAAADPVRGRAQPPTHLAAIVQRAQPDPKALSLANALQLQRAIGNRAAGKLLSAGAPRPVIQAKLTVGPAHDTYEQEADRVAARVMAAPTPSAPLAPRARTADALQAITLATRLTPLAHRSAGGFEASAEFGDRLGAARGGG